MQAVQNLGIASVILIAGVLLENYGYLMLEIVFEGLLCFSLFCGIIITSKFCCILLPYC
jgi:predicted MFS family arabinose efflux permease